MNKFSCITCVFLFISTLVLPMNYPKHAFKNKKTHYTTRNYTHNHKKKALKIVYDGTEYQPKELALLATKEGLKKATQIAHAYRKENIKECECIKQYLFMPNLQTVESCITNGSTIFNEYKYSIDQLNAAADCFKNNPHIAAKITNVQRTLCPCTKECFDPMYLPKHLYLPKHYIPKLLGTGISGAILFSTPSAAHIAPHIFLGIVFGFTAYLSTAITAILVREIYMDLSGKLNSPTAKAMSMHLQKEAASIQTLFAEIQPLIIKELNEKKQDTSAQRYLVALTEYANNNIKK